MTKQIFSTIFVLQNSAKKHADKALHGVDYLRDGQANTLLFRCGPIPD